MNQWLIKHIIFKNQNLTRAYLWWRKWRASVVDEQTRHQYLRARRLATQAINKRIEYNLPVVVPDEENERVMGSRYTRYSDSRYDRRMG
jgi:hypothetical protein